MLNQFTVLGCGTNQRGLTIGINYKITSDSTAKATAHAMLQAQRDGLTRIRITRVMGVTA